MSDTLHGRIVALAEGRQLEELARLLESEGATTLRCPMLSIIDAPDPAPIVAWLRELRADHFSHVILLTGEGLRRLLGLALREGLRDAVIAALQRARIVTRGPKPVQALREVGLTPTLVASVPTTSGVIATLQSEPLSGRTVGVQLYSESNAPLIQFLEEAGATVRTVLPYVYAPSADADRVADLMDRMAEGQVDVIVFTSAPQVDRLYQIAEERGLTARLTQGLERTRVAAVGPVVADKVRSRGARVDILPAQGFVMKNLVQHIKRHFASAS
jgi:uroporphyrinogen-III synthase